MIYIVMDLDSLYDAAIAGDADAIAELEARANRVDKKGYTILHIESTNGNTERVRFILRQFANKNLLTKLTTNRHTALHKAIYHGHTEVAKVLIDAATFLPTTSFQDFLRQGDKDMDTALHAAVMERNLAIVKLLVEADSTDRHTQNDQGKTPMYIAVEKGFNDVAEIISTTCTAPSLDGPDGRTAVRIKNLDQVKSPGTTLYKIMDRDALYAAAIAGDADAIAVLEEKANRVDKKGYTILHTESTNGNTERVRFILREFANKNLLTKLTIYKHTALHKAIYHGHTEVAKVLIDAATHLPVDSFQAFLRQGDKDMDTALHAAVKERNLAIVKLLVEADRTDRHIQNDEGKTPMYIAVEKGFNDIAEIISTTCIAPSFDGPYGSSVVRIDNLDQVKSPGGTLYKIKDRYTFYDAAIAGDANAIAKLEKEANKLNCYDETILHVESELGKTECVRFLLKEFASKNLLVKLNKYKQTALHLAIYNGHTEVAEVLIDAATHLPPANDNPVTSFQAFLRQVDLYMNTALHAAVMERNIAIVKLLVEADPTDRHFQNDEGKTPMYIAVEKGYNDIAEIISTTSTAPSLDGPYGSSVVLIHNLEQVNSPGGTLYKIIDEYAWFAAAIDGDSDAIAKLEAQVDKLNYYDETILHVESERGKTECVRLLLKEFANKNLLVKLNKYKQTALHLAIHQGHTEVAEVLIDAARQHLQLTSFQDFLRQGDEDMYTALHAAVIHRHVDIVKLLVEADGADKHIKNNYGKTPIYLGVERGYSSIVKVICTTCTAPSLDGPGRSTALHAAISNIREAKEENRDVTRMLIEQAKNKRIEGFFDRTDEKGLSLLELAAGKNDLEVLKLLLQSDPAIGRGNKKNTLMRSIYISYDKKYSDMVNVLSEAYEAGKIGVHKGKTNSLMPIFRKSMETGEAENGGGHKGVVSLILAIRKHDKDEIRHRLKDAQLLVNFAEDEGWTPLHYVAYHNFYLILDVFIEAQKQVGHPFLYEHMVSTPFHVAAEKGYTSMVIQLMQLWPSSSSACTAVNKIGRNILHIAAAESNKEMIQGILKYCPPIYKDKILKQQDAEGDTFLHLLFNNGCFIREVIKHEGLVTMTKNNKKWTPRDMLYFSDDVIADQAQIKLALDDEDQTKRSRIFWWKSTKKKLDFLESKVSAPKREAKDAIFNKRKISWKAEKHERMERERKTNLGKYKERTNTQIIVCALITTVTFTVGFTMPGGLRQSEQVDEGLAVLSRKTAFHAFMVSDALALLLSTSSLFFYFLGSMTEDHHQVAKLGVASTVFNIVSIMAMMLTFIAGTYVVLSHSPALAITVCVIGSLFFLLLVVLLIKIVCDRQVKTNED